MSTQFYQVHPSMVQNAMGGTHMHTPQSIFQSTMNNPDQQKESPWLQVPDIPPMTMPWTTPSSTQQPDLVQTFNCTYNQNSFGYTPKKKRSFEMTTPDVLDFRPAKQLITEEKMAQHFSDLHIGSSTTNTQTPDPLKLTTTESHYVAQTSNVEADSPVTNVVEKIQTDSEPRLVISEEIKRLQDEPLIPSCLLSKLERPSMALVLWQPPIKHLPMLPTPSDTPTPIISTYDNNANGMVVEQNINETSNNNNESIPDYNQTMDINISDSTLEPMDL